MTCIVGFVENGKVYIGGDSAGVLNTNIELRKDKKVFKKGDMIFGFTGSFRMGQILKYHFIAPENKKDSDLEYLCTDFIDELTFQFLDKKYAKIDNNEAIGGTFLLGYKGHLYCVQDDFQVSELINNYDSCGCGANFALGALYAMENQSMPPEERIETALKAAEHFSNAVQGPFDIVKI